MRYAEVPINIAVGENRSRSPHWSNSTCVNMFPEIQKSGRTESALLPWPGEKPFSSGVSGTLARGMHVVAGVPYVLLDQTLYKIFSNGVQQAVGTVPGYDYVNFSDDGANLMIRIRGSATYINGKFILQGPGETFFFQNDEIETLFIPRMNSDEALVSDVDLPRTYRYAPIKSQISGGDFRQVYKFQQKIFFAGDSFIDVYYDSGEGDPPVKPILQASSTNVGVASSSSMAQTPNFLYLLSNEGVAYRVSNFELQKISSSSVSKAFRENDTSKALGMTCQIDGQWFYILQLRGTDVTMAYSEDTGEWIRLSSGIKLTKQAHLVQGYAFAYDKHLVLDFASSNVYEWDFSTYTSNGSPILREFTTAPVNGSMLGAPGSRLVMNRCRFLMENGVGNADEFDPDMMIDASFDGGRTFSSENNVKLQRAGNSTTLVDWDSCHVFYDVSLRVRVTDPVFCSVHSIILSVKKAGY